MSTQPTINPLTVAENSAVAPGNLRLARAYWLTADLIAWDVPARDDRLYQLHYDPEGAIRFELSGLQGGTAVPLTPAPDAMPEATRVKFPHLAHLPTFQLNRAGLAAVADMLQCQVVVSLSDGDGRLLDATSLQIAGVLDDLYPYDGPLGVIYEGLTPTLKLWAPTARAVRLHLFTDSQPDSPVTAVAMTFDPTSGVWSVSGEPGWTGAFYLYEVELFVPETGRVERNLVTDPYSVSLASNSRRSQIVNLADPTLLPLNWASLSKPSLADPNDIVLYELHVRDFSMADASVRPEYRGTFMAFTETAANGRRHLRRLAEAGLTHLHLLPVFDFATVNENQEERQEADWDLLATFPPDSEQQQALVSALHEVDGYNWGYDPYHFNVPEGSYATDPDGPARIVQFRQMVQALNEIGLRLVMDVVYNHTHAAGQHEQSVFDRIVPGYYHRLDEDGRITTSSCCPNTAAEHAMMAKFIIDSILLWATAYKVDGFRFDLMGHHMASTMVKIRQALDALTVAKDGVDGRAVYLYGEGWNFGEVADNARGVNATQFNLAGTGIGTFNDRLRDAARGGKASDGLLQQGFVTGLYVLPNGSEQGSDAEQRTRLLQFMDQIRVGLAGNLRDFTFVDACDQTVNGWQVGYDGSPTGYTAQPQEHIAYVSAHDNETLFDAVQYKAPFWLPLADRVRLHNLGLSLTALAQGIPFFHAGDDMLRSKSLDRNSFNSGDWFNRLDFTYRSNNWGVGLPPAESNRPNWDLMRPLLANPDLRPTAVDIGNAVAHFQEMLRIRRSSPLFRLRTAAAIQERLTFYNTGRQQFPGLIVMALSDKSGEKVDPHYKRIVVFFNATPHLQPFHVPACVGATLSLHPIQRQSHDPLVRTATFSRATGTFTVPGWTTAVFVEPVARPKPARWPWLVTAVGSAIIATILRRLWRNR
jgi:pullulanase